MSDTAEAKAETPNDYDILTHLRELFTPGAPPQGVAPEPAPPEAWFEIVWDFYNTRHFSPTQLDEAAAFAIARNKAGSKVYVTPGLRHGKALGKDGAGTKENFLMSYYAWTEYDQKGDDARIWALLKEKDLRPTLVVTTGLVPWPRRHLYFRLKEAITSFPEMDATNKALGNFLGADKVFDARRIMRLAGTLNYPRADKVGRVVEVTTLSRPPAPAYPAAHLLVLGGGVDNVINLGDRKPGRTPDDLIALLELTKIEGKWHDNMRDAIASMIGKGWTDEAIRVSCSAYCEDGADDQDLDPLINGARKKWKKSNDEATRRAEQLKQNAAIGEKSLTPNLPTILTVSEMEARLVWIGSSGAVVDRKTGRIRRKENAPAAYAASLYVPEGEKKAIPCLPIWLKSKKRDEVDALVWVPGMGEFCPVPEYFGGHEKGFNIWRGLEILPYPEDWQERAKPFIDHVAFLVPVKEECDRFMQWLAHIVQCPEVLPHTYYLMIAETQGIGRNLLASILVRVLRGHVAAGISISDLLDEKFNGRLSQKLLFIVDELREGTGAQRYQRENKLRSVITQEVRLINPKFGVQSVEKNCCRGLMFSNHMDAIPLDNADRRAQVIANPSEPRDVEYYEKLYSLIDDPFFIGSVRHFLTTHDIKNFKPGAHATMNTAKMDAIDSTKDMLDRGIEQFKEMWKNGLCFRKHIDEYVGALQESVPHITNAISRAGMVNTSRRIRDEGEKLQTIVIVNRAEWTSERVAEATPEALRIVINGKW
jgi:Family of unknown function (DUF5906)